VVEIKSKQLGKDLYSSGFFGNTLRNWASPEDLNKELQEGKNPPVKLVLRQAMVQGGGICIYDLEPNEAINQYVCLQEHGEQRLYLSEQLPGQPGNILFQGEYCNGGEGEFLRASSVKDFHRPAMEVAEDFNGASCRPVLRDNMDLGSYERLIELSEAFPDHVIEFTLCDESVGSESKPTIVWEVRRY
jgi:hypothetical protein